MTTIDFITELFCNVDDNIDDNKHSQGKLYPSEVVTIAYQSPGPRPVSKSLSVDNNHIQRAITTLLPLSQKVSEALKYALKKYWILVALWVSSASQYFL